MLDRSSYVGDSESVLWLWKEVSGECGAVNEGSEGTFEGLYIPLSITRCVQIYLTSGYLWYLLYISLFISYRFSAVSKRFNLADGVVRTSIRCLAIIVQQTVILHRPPSYPN